MPVVRHEALRDLLDRHTPVQHVERSEHRCVMRSRLGPRRLRLKPGDQVRGQTHPSSSVADMRAIWASAAPHRIL